MEQEEVATKKPRIVLRLPHPSGKRLVLVMSIIIAIGIIAVFWGELRRIGGAPAMESEQDRLEYWRSTSGLYPIQQEEQYGFINDSGEVIVNPQFERVGEFSEGLAPVKFDGKWGYIDKKGNYVVNPQFDAAEAFFEKRAAVKLEDQWGYIDPAGSIVINPQFERVDRFHNGLALVRQDDRWGFIDDEGKYLINPQFDRAGVFTDGLAPVTLGSKVGYIEESGTYGINLQFDDAAPFHENLGRVRSGSRWGFVDKSGKYVINPQFSAAGDFHEGHALVRVGSRWGYVDRKGKFIINPQFDGGGDFQDGLAIVQLGEHFGFVDHDGKVVINPQFASAYPFARNGLALVNSEGKWGFLNQKGKLVIAPQYSSANPFWGSLAFIKRDRFSGGYINTRGEFVWKLEPPARIAEALRLGRTLDDSSHQAVFQELGQFVSTTRGLVQSNWNFGPQDASSLATQVASGKKILARLATVRQQIASESFNEKEVGQIAGEIADAISATENQLAELVRRLEGVHQVLSTTAREDAWQQIQQFYGELWRLLNDLEDDDPVDRGKNRVLQVFDLAPSDLRALRQQSSLKGGKSLPDLPPPPPPPPPRPVPTSNLQASALGREVSDREAQRRTVSDIRQIGTAMFSWLTDRVGAGAAGQSQFDLARYPGISGKELGKILVPQYIQAVSETDGWGNPYEFYLNVTSPQAKQVMSIRSSGREGRFSANRYIVGAFPPGDYDEDIVWADGYFVRWPQTAP